MGQAVLVRPVITGSILWSSAGQRAGVGTILPCQRRVSEGLQPIPHHRGAPAVSGLEKPSAKAGGASARHEKARCGGPSGLLAGLEEPLPPADEVAGDADETACPKGGGDQTKANERSCWTVSLVRQAWTQCSPCGSALYVRVASRNEAGEAEGGGQPASA